MQGLLQQGCVKTIVRLTLFSLLTQLLFSGFVLAADNVVYFHNDALGSPVAATDQTGRVLWREEYKPYGKRLLNENQSADNKLWFTGKYEEAELGGLQYFGARWYHPDAGRFMSMDPAGVIEHVESNPMMFNRYAYANNNPYSFVDPDGREVMSVNHVDNATIERRINSLSSGIFKFNKSGRLRMVSETGGQGGSDYYTRQLKVAIDHTAIATIKINHSDSATIKDVKTSLHGGGNSQVQITNDTYNLKGFGDSVVKGTPETNLAHELVEHAIPHMDGIPTNNGNPAFRENIVRRQNKLDKRSGEDH